MGLFDGVLGGVVGAGAVAVLQHYLDSHGGLEGVVAEFEKSGYGQQVKSWVGDGSNLPISVDDVKKALGSDKLKQIAASTGIPIDEVAKSIAEHLPSAVDKSTPAGVLPPKA